MPPFTNAATPNHNNRQLFNVLPFRIMYVCVCFKIHVENIGNVFFFSEFICMCEQPKSCGWWQIVGE